MKPACVPFPANRFQIPFPPYTGTEENNELCSHMPGPACPANSGNVDAGPGEGYVHAHRGFHGVGDLSEADYAWLNPAAEVFIARPVEL